MESLFGLFGLLGFILVIGLIVIPIMTFTNASRAKALEQKIRDLENRVQQQGITLKELYTLLEKSDPLHWQRGSKYKVAAEELVDKRAQGDEHVHQQMQDSSLEPASEPNVVGSFIKSQPELVDRPTVMTKADDSSNGVTSKSVDELVSKVTNIEALNESVSPEFTQVTAQEEVRQQQNFAKEGVVFESASQSNEADLPLHESNAFSESDEVREKLKASKHTAQRKPRTQRAVKEPLIKLPSVSDLLVKGLNYVKQWFKTGNVPVKIGVLVLLAGVGALLNYAATQGWVSLPISAKLVLVAAASVGAFVFAWVKREKNRAFSISMQGGAIGVLLLTIFAAFKLYNLIPGALAFGLTIALIGFMGFLAVKQNAMAMAIFAVLAGFMAPIWLSEGSGNYVALFSYYAVLNAGILGMSWFRPWRHLNLMGFVFTFGIGSAWGWKNYVPEMFATTEPFLVLFFVFYLCIPIFYARKYIGALRNKVDASLVFGTPLIGFSLQSVLLQDNRYALAGCAFGLGLLYFVLRQFSAKKEYLKEFAPAYLALGLGFITLAVPLAFSAQQTSCIYALEGAALVWWGGRQSRVLSSLGGIALQLLSSIAFLFTVGSFASEALAMPLLNGTFINMLIMAGAAFFSAWCYKQQNSDVVTRWLQQQGWKDNFVAHAFHLLGLFWWIIAGAREISLFVPFANQADFAILFAVFSAWLAAEANKKWASHLLGLTTMVGLYLPFAFVFWQTHLEGTPLTAMGAVAWAAYIILGARSIMLWRSSEAQTYIIKTQLVWWPTLTVVATLALNALLKPLGWSNDLSYAITALPLLTVLGLSLWRWTVLRLPLGAMFDGMRDGVQSLFFIVGLVIWTAGMLLPTSNGALPWMPVLNPIELLQLVFVGMMWVWLKTQNTQRWLTKNFQGGLLASMGLLMISVITFRAVHHWGGVEWSEHIISNRLTQTSLSILWSILGVVAWIWGSRKNQRLVWWAGAILMGVVLAKLVLIDRQELGNILGIVSFIGYGLLCVVVGYFAPAPPKEVLNEKIQKNSREEG